MKKIYSLIVLTGFYFFSDYSLAQPDCASIKDPDLMMGCIISQRSKNTEKTIKNYASRELGPTPSINDWKQVGPVAGGQATFYFSPSSAKYKEISDPESATGSSRVVVINTMQDFASPHKKGDKEIRSTVITAVYHCNFPNIKEMRFEAHSGKMGSGKIVSTHEVPSEKKWGPLSDGDDVVIEYVRNICPPIGHNYPEGPLTAIFVCSDQSPNKAKFKTENILREMIKYGAESASRLMIAYKGCFAKIVEVENIDYLKKAELIGTREDAGYYVIDADSTTSFGAVGN